VIRRLRRWWTGVRPGQEGLKSASIVALPRAAAAVPDAMASASLVGVNPIHGLYAAFLGPIVGGLTTSTKLIVVTTTSASALAAFSALEGVSPDDRLSSLILMTIIAGGIMLLAGFLGLGRFTAFVSHSVMTGFLTGVAISIILRQIPDLVGADVDAPRSVGKALQVFLHPGSIDLPSLLVGLSALLLLLSLPYTPLKRYAALVALIAPSLVVAWVGYFSGVEVVADAGEIVRGIPLPALPSLRQFDFDLLAGAFAVAAIVLVQASGVSQSYPNPDGSRSDVNADFMSQGWANVASGFFRGIPVGGSVSQTALSVSLGARDRWASILSGAWVLLVLVLLSRLVGKVAIPTLAAILIIASIGAVRPAVIGAVWASGPQAQIAMVTTFIATLLLPVSAAVGIGVALSLLLSVNREALDVRLRAISERPDGSMVEGPVPESLESGTVTVINVYGSLFYAGARTFEDKLPDVGHSEKAVVVVNMRGRPVIGSTALSVLSRYASRLDSQGGRLYLSGIDPELKAQLENAGLAGDAVAMRLVEATPTLGESTRRAITDAQAFLVTDTGAPEEEAAPDPWVKRVLDGARHLFSERDRSN